MKRSQSYTKVSVDEITQDEEENQSTPHCKIGENSFTTSSESVTSTLQRNSFSQDGEEETMFTFPIDEEEETKTEKYDRSKSAFRWIVLILASYAMFGGFYCLNTPAALTNQLMNEYNLSDTEYNLLFSLYAIPNIVLPLFGGVFVDRFGSSVSLILFLSLSTIGHGLFALGSSINSYLCMLIGRGLFGIGNENVDIAIYAILSQHFASKQLAFAMAVKLAMGHYGSALNNYATFKIYEMNNSVPEALWTGFFLLCLCLIGSMIVVILDYIKAKKKVSEGYSLPETENGDGSVRCSDIKEFNASYWLITICSTLFYGCIWSWHNIGSVVLQSQYGLTEERANSFLVIVYFTSAVCAPFLGFVWDQIGRRALFMLLAMIDVTAAHFIFAFFHCIPPFVPLFLLGFGYSIYATVLWPCIPIVVDAKYLGTAYGLIFCVQNLGLSIFPIIVGQLSQMNASAHYQYVGIFFFALGCITTLLQVVLITIDRFRGSHLAKVYSSLQLMTPRTPR